MTWRLNIFKVRDFATRLSLSKLISKTFALFQVIELDITQLDSVSYDICLFSKW